MQGCTGIAVDNKIDRQKPCPIRTDCWRYNLHSRKERPAGYDEMRIGPYDFEDEECSQHVEG